METIDRQTAARVWQRVTAGTRMPQWSIEELHELISQEWVNAATYLQLSRQVQGSHSATLRRLFQQEQSHAACLKGICNLITGTVPTVHAPKLPQEPVETVLRRCYGQQMRCLARYEAKSADPEYGQVFARLAEQERQHCHMLLEILGSLKKK